MGIDIGLPPLVNLLVATLVLIIISDFLLEIFSVRLSLATGRVQAWLFEHFGQNLCFDLIIAILFQGFSFRKRAFFHQLGALINVGSFSHRQLLLLIPASLFGMSLSLIFLLGGTVSMGAVLLFAGFFLSFNSKEQIKDVGLALLSLSLFVLALYFFGLFLKSSSLNIHNYQIHEPLVFGFVIAAGIFFRTPIAMLMILALVHFTMGLNVVWLPLLFFVYGVVSLAGFYANIFRKRSRLYFSIFVLFGTQLAQLILSGVAVWFFQESLQSYLVVSHFVEAYQVILLFAVFFGVSPLMLTPVLVFIASRMSLTQSEAIKKQPQKILISGERGQNFSIHLSLFLMRQEFKKFTTSLHTLLKMAREAGGRMDELDHRYSRYQSMLVRVGDELKELCFSIGRQRSYRWQVQEVMTYYKMVNQLELLIDDMGHVTRLLSEKHFDENQEKDCRFWLGLQLKIFESFLHHTLGVGYDDPEKVKSHIEKSYEVLDRFFVGDRQGGRHKGSSQTFYRITDSMASLAT